MDESKPTIAELVAWVMLGLIFIVVIYVALNLGVETGVLI